MAEYVDREAASKFRKRSDSYRSLRNIRQNMRGSCSWKLSRAQIIKASFPGKKSQTGEAWKNFVGLL